MFGRMRKSTVNSLEVLEMERAPSKIIKTDSLSVYESTLLKLRRGSQNMKCNPDDCAVMNTHYANMDTDASAKSSPIDIDASTRSSPNSMSAFRSNDSEEDRSKGMCILHYFRVQPKD